jgi:hypothetical protein
MSFQAVKFVNHADHHPEDPVLRVRPLVVEEIKVLSHRLSRLLDASSKLSLDELLLILKGKLLTPVGGVDADSESFRFTELVAGLPPVQGANLLLYFGFPGDVWRISLSDLDQYFDSVWYQGPDDLVVIPENLSWFVNISEQGEVTRWIVGE